MLSLGDLFFGKAFEGVKVGLNEWLQRNHIEVEASRDANGDGINANNHGRESITVKCDGCLHVDHDDIDELGLMDGSSYEDHARRQRPKNIFQ